MVIAMDYLFWNDLACLVGSGVPLRAALKVLAETAEDEGWGHFATHAGHDLDGGKSFFKACSDHADLMSPFILAIIEHGEKAGRLEEGLDRIVEHLEAHAEVEAAMYDDDDEFGEDFYDDEFDDDLDDDEIEPEPPKEVVKIDAKKAAKKKKKD